MALNSRVKGAVGERAACEALAEHLGLTARRSQQHCATDSASDIIVNETPRLWWEIKRTQRINVAAVMQRSKKDCGDKIPVLMHRPNHSEWMVTVYLPDLLAVLNDIQIHRPVLQAELSSTDKAQDMPAATVHDAGTAGLLQADRAGPGGDCHIGQPERAAASRDIP